VDLTGARWRTSSYSTGNSDSDNCVEVAFLPGGTVAVRDSKDRSQPAQLYPATAWTGLIAALRAN
jgi:hypothetical protein